MPKSYVDVVEDFDYSSENDSYNRDYQLWRRNSPARCMYRFAGNINENVYVSGEALDKPQIQHVERQALMHSADLLGLGLLILFIAQLAGGTLLEAFFRLLHFEVHTDFLKTHTDGSQWAVTALNCCVTLLKYGIPSLILLRVGRIRRRVAMPACPGGLPEMICAAGFAMIISGVYAMVSSSAGVETAQRIFSYKNAEAIMAFGIFEALIGSFMAELFLRSAVLTILRQFGDGFSIAVSAIIGFLMPNSTSDRISELMLGLACSYILIRSGSFWKCVIVRILYTVLVYARLILIYTSHVMPLWQYALLLVATGTLLVAFFVRIRKDMVRLSNRRTALSDGQKVYALTQSVTMLPWAAVSILLALLQLFM